MGFELWMFEQMQRAWRTRGFNEEAFQRPKQLRAAFKSPNRQNLQNVSRQITYWAYQLRIRDTWCWLSLMPLAKRGTTVVDWYSFILISCGRCGDLQIQDAYGS